jgi:prepilin-type processing-associated H-X9-DG protein
MRAMRTFSLRPPTGLRDPRDGQGNALFADGAVLIVTNQQTIVAAGLSAKIACQGMM